MISHRIVASISVTVSWIGAVAAYSYFWMTPAGDLFAVGHAFACSDRETMRLALKLGHQSDHQALEELRDQNRLKCIGFNGAEGRLRAMEVSDWGTLTLVRNVGEIKTYWIRSSELRHANYYVNLRPSITNVEPNTNQTERVTPTKTAQSSYQPEFSRIIAQNLNGEQVAPLTIRTSQGANFFVKLVDRQRSSMVTLLIAGGAEFKLKMPVGEYLMTYATGPVWRNEISHFGSNSLYFRADKSFEFKRTTAGFAGHVIELILRPDGNLHTALIDVSQF